MYLHGWMDGRKEGRTEGRKEGGRKHPHGRGDGIGRCNLEKDESQKSYSLGQGLCLGLS